MIKEVFSLDRIALDEEVSSKKRAFEQLSELLCLHNETPSVSTVLTALLNRETLGSTFLDHGIALPHARIDELAHTRGAIIRLSHPLQFDPEENEATLLIGLIVPNNAKEENQHLEILQLLMQNLRESSVREILLNTHQPEQIIECLTQIH